MSKAPILKLPTRGGSFIRQEDGSLERTDGPAVTQPPKLGKTAKAPAKPKAKES